MAKILILDIENAPNLAGVWRLYDENVSTDLLFKEHYILSWAAKWHGQDKIYFDSLEKSSKKQMLKGMYSLLNQADIVIHYNGKKHDIAFFNKEFLEVGMTPPSPYKQIDVLRTVRSKFKFPSNRLGFVVKSLGVGKKVDHEGYGLWTKCIQGDKDAWKRMKQYNIQDVILTEKLYIKVRPWISDHPNIGLYLKNSLVCPYCQSKNFQEDGVAVSKSYRYVRYVCDGCGGWFRGTKPAGPKTGEKYATI